MKLVAVIGALSLLFPGVSRAAETPEAGALSFLSELQGAGSTIEDIVGGTLLSPFCGDRKREWIEERLKRLREELRAGGVEWRVLETKQDGDYAAVLVVLTTGGDPFGVDVLGIGARKEEGRWKVAPLPGRFDNTNVGFDPETRSRVSQLERWMGEQEVLKGRELYHAAILELEGRMKAAASAELLRGGSAEEVVQGFLTSCRERKLAEVLVFLDADLGRPDEPTSPQSIVSRGLRGDEELSEWQLLTSPDVVSVVAETQKERSETVVSVLFYDAESVTGARLMKFSLNHDGERWQVDLPRVLREAYTERRPWRRPDGQEQELRRRFAEFFEASCEPERFADAEEMAERVDEVLQGGTLREFFALLFRDDTTAEGERLVSYSEAANLWHEFREREREANHGELVEVLVQGTAAVVVLHLVTTAELDRLELVTLLLIRDEDGWAIAPGVTSLGNWEAMPKQEAVDQKEILMKFVRQKSALEKKAAEELLNGFAEVTATVQDKVSKEEAGQVVRTFRMHLRAGELQAAFACCALLDRSEGAWEALKSLSYEYRGARRAGEPDHELLVQESGAWAGVSLRLSTGPAGVPDYPLYLVRSTAQGPRIVVDAGLRLPTNKGREIVNDQIWEHLGEELEQEELALVRTLFEGHVGRSQADYDAWEKNTKLSR